MQRVVVLFLLQFLLCLLQQHRCFDRSISRQCAFQWRLADGFAGAIASSVAHNWKHGIQAHRVCFEGINSLRHIRLYNNSLLIGDSSGRVCIVKVDSKDEILYHHKVHEMEITALDLDREMVACASKDGVVSMACLKDAEGSDLTPVVRRHTNHDRPVTGIKIYRESKRGVPLVISCGMDRRLVAVDSLSAEVKYNTLLEASPLCADLNGGYLALGTDSGWVIFFNARTGKQILRFQAFQGCGVRSICFQDQANLLTGGTDGVIKVWDLSSEGEEEEEEEDGGVASGSSFPASADRPTRLIDFFFSDAINSAKRPSTGAAANGGKGGAIKSREKSGFKEFKHSSIVEPVVSLQGDSKKIVAAYAEGTICVWDVVKGEFNFDIKGRSSYLSSVQIDATRLIADGTNALIIVHDFANAANSTDEIILSDSYEN